MFSKARQMLRREGLSVEIPKSEEKPIGKWSYEIRFEDGKKYKKFKAQDIELVKEKGRGSFGTVFEALHTQSRRRIAVKQILLQGTIEGQLEKELKITKNIGAHDSIVHFYGLTFKEGICYICMELMDADLKRLYMGLSKIFRPLSDEFIATVAVSVVDGLQYLKVKHNVMHRDVKPSNILLDTDGHAKLCDFGVSGYLIRSVAKTYVGTAAYLAPERIESCGSYTVAADVWSLGITLFEVATGSHPYEEPEVALPQSDNSRNCLKGKRTAFIQLSEIAQKPAPQLDDSCDRSKELKDFINSCLTKDCKQRPKYDELVMTALYKQVKANVSQAAGIVRDCVVEYLKLQNEL